MHAGLAARDRTIPGMAFEPKHAIVTGSDSGIGRATAVALAEAGMDVGITWVQDHEQQQAEETAQEVRAHGRRAEVARLNANDLDIAASVIDELAERLGGLIKTAALELGRYGITANAVAPGEIATPMTGMEDQDPTEVHRPGVPLGRPGNAHEIAAVVAFLASPAASYVTGASWPVDGGMLQMGPQGGSNITSDDWRDA